jgi:hypothetical protein
MPILLKRFAIFLIACVATQFALSQKTPTNSAEAQQHIKMLRVVFCPA